MYCFDFRPQLYNPSLMRPDLLSFHHDSCCKQAFLRGPHQHVLSSGSSHPAIWPSLETSPHTELARHLFKKCRDSHQFRLSRSLTFIGSATVAIHSLTFGDFYLPSTTLSPTSQRPQYRLRQAIGAQTPPTMPDVCIYHRAAFLTPRRPPHPTI